jgi:hypothetical protein
MRSIIDGGQGYIKRAEEKEEEHNADRKVYHYQTRNPQDSHRDSYRDMVDFQVILSMAYQEEPRVEEAPVMTTALDWVRFTAIRRSDTELRTPWLFSTLRSLLDRLLKTE